MRRADIDIISSFANITFLATRQTIEDILGEPVHYLGDDKVQYEWNCITSCGVPIKIYDWKEGGPTPADEEIWWHSEHAMTTCIRYQVS